MPRRLFPATIALALAASGFAVMAPASSAPADQSTTSVAKKASTRFAFTATGYGTRVIGGMVPAESGTTAFTSIACTNETGKNNTNHVAAVNVPGLGTVAGVDTEVSTKKVDGAVVSESRHDVASVQLIGTPLGSLSLTGLHALSRVTHDDKGYHAYNETSVADIVLTPAGGLPPIAIPIPSLGMPITIPGLATITLGKGIAKERADGALAQANAVFIHVIPTDTKVKIARSSAKIDEGVKSGIFNGSSSPIRAAVVGDLVDVGRAVNSIMPCQGTDGVLKEKSAAGVNLADQIVVGAAYSRQTAKQTKGRAVGYEESGVAEVNIANQLIINAINARATVARSRDGLRRSIKGTTIGAITFNGEPMALPDLDGFEIPGVARIDTNVVKRLPTGISVIAIQVTLLDGTLAVVNIGEARMRVRAANNN